MQPQTPPAVCGAWLPAKQALGPRPEAGTEMTPTRPCGPCPCPLPCVPLLPLLSPGLCFFSCQTPTSCRSLLRLLPSQPSGPPAEPGTASLPSSVPIVLPTAAGPEARGGRAQRGLGLSPPPLSLLPAKPRPLTQGTPQRHSWDLIICVSPGLAWGWHRVTTAA